MAKPPSIWASSTVLTEGAWPRPSSPRDGTPRKGKDPGRCAGSKTRTAPHAPTLGQGMFSSAPGPGSRPPAEDAPGKGMGHPVSGERDDLVILATTEKSPLRNGDCICLISSSYPPWGPTLSPSIGQGLIPPFMSATKLAHSCTEAQPYLCPFLGLFLNHKTTFE